MSLWYRQIKYWKKRGPYPLFFLVLFLLLILLTLKIKTYSFFLKEIYNIIYDILINKVHSNKIE